MSATELDDVTVVVLAPNPSPLTLEGTNTYLLGAQESGEVVVVDPGPDRATHRRAVEAALAARAARVVAVVLTHHHGDHAGAAGWADDWGVPSYAFDPATIPGTRPLADGDVVERAGVALEVLHTPGHTADHLCLQVRGTGAVLTGDHVLGRGTTVVAEPDGDMAAYMSSLHRLRRRAPAVLYPGHGPVVRDPAAVVQAYLRHREERERQVLAAVRAGDATAGEIVARLYADVDPALHAAAAQSVRAHLAKLAAEGRVVWGDSFGVRTIQSTPAPALAGPGRARTGTPMDDSVVVRGGGAPVPTVVPPSPPLPPSRSIVVNPSQEELRQMVQQMPNAQSTQFGNWNVRARVTARSAGSTFVITDDPDSTTKQTMSRADHDAVVARQEAYLADADLVVVEGYIGPEGSPLRRPARVAIERGYANIPAMQQQLYYPRDDDWREEDALTVLYTPGCPAPGFPDERLVTIDCERWTTRVFGIDYFGESKMGGLRMWMEWVYQQGGLAMHSGAKLIPTRDGGEKVVLIVGLSGTGKTTTTFTRQNGSLPVQDDIVALVEGGRVYATENGCFAKTIGLDPALEPTIHAALASPEGWLENVAVDEEGRVDFADGSYTANGRGTFGLAAIPHHDPRRLGRADVLLILNRNETVVPAVAKMASVEQAVAYFMLGETKGTSAGGVAEAGKSLRVPGTNPFFLRHDALQGNRLEQLIRSMEHDFGVYVLSTGRVGGGPDVEGSKKVRIPDSSAIVAGIAEGTIAWETDPDFGYLVATDVPGIDDPELLQPRRLYERLGRADEYRAHVERLTAERTAYLEGHEGLSPAVVAAVRPV